MFFPYSINPKGFNNLEILINHKPGITWRFANKDELIEAMQKRLVVFLEPQFNFPQAIWLRASVVKVTSMGFTLKVENH